MWLERLKRIIILLVIVGIVYVGVNFFIRWKSQGNLETQVLGSVDNTTNAILESGQSTLEKIIDDIPIDPSIKETISSTDIEKIKGISITAPEVEIKKLPEMGEKELKKILFKDFCEQVMQ